MIGNGLLASPKDAALGAALIVVLLFVFAALWLLTGLKKCPSDKILVVIGKLPKDANGCPQTSICVHGGAVFVVPLLQKHYYLDLNPLVCPVEIKKVVFSDDRTADVLRFYCGDLRRTRKNENRRGKTAAFAARADKRACVGDPSRSDPAGRGRNEERMRKRRQGLLSSRALRKGKRGDRKDRIDFRQCTFRISL